MEENIENSKKYLIKIENFEGPLDLLCFLIDKNKMDIFDIKLDEITEQYIEYLNQMEKYNLDVASDFLLMASTLIYLKSKRLLPKLEPEEVEEITEEELAKRILEYKLYKDFSNELKERYEIYSKRFFKEADKIELPKKKIDKEYDKLIIPNTYYNLVKRNENLKNINYENVNKLAEYEKVTVRSKARDILKQLMRKPKFVFNKIFAIGKVTKLEKVTAFLSLLELAKIKRITINQNETFGDITIEKMKKVK